MKSFDQTFSKVCGFQRQRLWPLSAESGIPLRHEAQEGSRKRPGDGFGVGNPRRGFLSVMHIKLLVKNKAAQIERPLDIHPFFYEMFPEVLS